MIFILDYGFGNKTSISNALKKLKIPHKVSDKLEDMNKSTHIILPGVGSFAAAMKMIKKKNFLEYLKKATEKKKFLGICLGMQLLFELSEESKGIKGLNFLKGKIKKIKTKKILPHIGWKKVNFKKNLKDNYNFKSDEKFYFLHSYMLANPNSYTKAEVLYYEQKIPAIVNFRNITGVQFHPERSGKQGLIFLKEFYSQRDTM